jgi:hypothetical protein
MNKSWEEEIRQAYLSDFMAAIRNVDDEVFLKRGYPSSSIVLIPERLEHVPGYFVWELAGYYPRYPSGFVRVLGPGGKRRTTYIPAYAIIEPLVLRCVANKLGRSGVDGMGDNEIRKLWYMCAIELVRYRVLASQLFPNIRPRTQKSMVKHRHLFTQTGNDFEALKNIARQLIKPVRGLNQSEPWSVDVFWTMQIIVRAIDSGASFAEAVAYIASD